MNKYFGYIRVSTAKQGEHGVSLPEQREAIERYVQRNGLAIVDWFEERETAAKRGRPIFGQMLSRLRRGHAKGVVIHKIDRSARNLKDWADLGELIDQGIEVHFANESLDLHSRGGRLSADIQAVVAADFIRNLREETRKGFYGRLKQGLYPLPSPLGYLDQGQGQLKALDPVRAPLVRQAFELYSSGRYTLQTLNDELYRLGLRTRRGGRVTRSSLSIFLNNPFYTGLISLKCTGETFAGAHPALISPSLYKRVQQVLKGKVCTRVQRHPFLFRRLIACKHCGYSLIGELQKGHVYYRCHTKNCPTPGIREEALEQAVRDLLQPLTFSNQEQAYLKSKVLSLQSQWDTERQLQEKTLQLRLDQTRDRLSRLTDAFLDRSIEKEVFEERKTGLLRDRLETEERLAQLRTENATGPDRLSKFLELANSLPLQWKLRNTDEKRELLQMATSNRRLAEEKVEFALSNPFQIIAEREGVSTGCPYRDRPRTLDDMLSKVGRTLLKNTIELSIPLFESIQRIVELGGED